MKRGIRIINCARGGIIDESALVEALDEGIVAGAAFDVFEHEPPSPDHPFLKHPKIIVTPHLGASTVEAQENVAVDVSEQVIHILRQEPFKNAVNMPAIPSDLLNQLQPWFTLCEQLGKWLVQMTEGAIREFTVECSGEFTDLDTSSLLPYVLKGYFRIISARNRSMSSMPFTWRSFVTFILRYENRCSPRARSTRLPFD